MRLIFFTCFYMRLALTSFPLNRFPDNPGAILGCLSHRAVLLQSLAMWPWPLQQVMPGRGFAVNKTHFERTAWLRPYLQPYFLLVPPPESGNLPRSMFRWLVPVAIPLRCLSESLSRTPASSPSQDRAQRILAFLQVVCCWRKHPRTLAYQTSFSFA